MGQTFVNHQKKLVRDGTEGHLYLRYANFGHRNEKNSHNKADCDRCDGHEVDIPKPPLGDLFIVSIAVALSLEPFRSAGQSGVIPDARGELDEAGMMVRETSPTRPKKTARTGEIKGTHGVAGDGEQKSHLPSGRKGSLGIYGVAIN